MIEALIDGERRGTVLADLAMGRLRDAGKMADLSMTLTGRFTGHHALMCRLHRDQIKIFDDAVAGLDAKIMPLVARYPDAATLLGSLPGFGEVVVAGWLGAIGPAPHQHFATAERLASWAAVRVPGRLQAKFNRLVRRSGGARNKAARKKAIIAIAHTLLKIAYQILKTGRPYQDLAAGFYTRRESPQARQDYLLKQLHKLNPGCTITITPAEAA